MTAEVRSPTPVRRILNIFEHEGPLTLAVVVMVVGSTKCVGEGCG
jgi:hypothetical protein